MNADAFRAKAARRGMGPVAETAWAPETVNPPHAHDFAAMLLMLDGEIEVTVGGRTHRCAAGDTFSLAAGVTHSERAGPRGARFLVARSGAA